MCIIQLLVMQHKDLLISNLKESHKTFLILSFSSINKVLSTGYPLVLYVAKQQQSPSGSARRDLPRVVCRGLVCVYSSALDVNSFSVCFRYRTVLA